MGHRQKGKHHKRKKSWHRGRGEERRWRRAERALAGTFATVKEGTR